MIWMVDDLSQTPTSWGPPFGPFYTRDDADEFAAMANAAPHVERPNTYVVVWCPHAR